MSNIFHSAYEQSTLAVSASQSGVATEKFLYDLEKPMPSLYLDRNTVHKVNNLTFAGSSSVELSSFGLLKEMYIKWKVKFTVAQAGAVNIAKHPYATIIKRIALMNSSRELFQIYGESILMKTKSLPYGERQKWLMAGEHDIQILPTAVNGRDIQSAVAVANVSTQGGFDVSTGEKTITFYTRVPWSFMKGRFQAGENNHDYLKTIPNLRFSEVTRVLIETNEAINVVAGGTGQALTNVKIDSCEVFCNYIIPSPQANQLIEAGNYSLDAPASYLYGNEVMNETTATVTSANGLHTHNVKIYNTNFTQGFTILIHKQRASTDALRLGSAIREGTANGLDKVFANSALKPNGANDPATATGLVPLLTDAGFRHASLVANGDSRYGNDFVTITKLVIKTSGRVLFEATDSKQLLLTTSDMINWCDGRGHMDFRTMRDRNGCSDNNIIYVPFSLLSNSNELSSGLSLRGLATCDLEITFQGVQNEVYDCKVITNYQQIVSLETTSGRFIASTSQ